jgi:hypothetical protein
MLLFSKVELKSVVISIPIISTARSRRPCFVAKASETKTAAADPSEVGQHWSLVKGPYTGGEARICSSVYSSRNWDFLLYSE